jgi:hypothetical protein
LPDIGSGLERGDYLARKDPPIEIHRINQPVMEKMVKALRIAAGFDKPSQSSYRNRTTNQQKT